MSLTININGKETKTKEGCLNDLLKELNINSSNIAIDVNGTIINKTEYVNLILKENDKIEIVRFMGGG
jgi:sulfur carrier protein